MENAEPYISLEIGSTDLTNNVAKVDSVTLWLKNATTFFF